VRHRGGWRPEETPEGPAKSAGGSSSASCSIPETSDLPKCVRQCLSPWNSKLLFHPKNTICFPLGKD
jgi:hypothetical protein